MYGGPFSTCIPGWGDRRKRAHGPEAGREIPPFAGTVCMPITPEPDNRVAPKHEDPFHTSELSRTVQAPCACAGTAGASMHGSDAEGEGGKQLEGCADSALQPAGPGPPERASLAG